MDEVVKVDIKTVLNDVKIRMYDRAWTMSHFGEDFMRLPTSAQSLFFHFLTHADDDGVVHIPHAIARMVGSSQDDIRLLFDNEYISDENGTAINIYP